MGDYGRTCLIARLLRDGVDRGPGLHGVRIRTAHGRELWNQELSKIEPAGIATRRLPQRIVNFACAARAATRQAPGLDLLRETCANFGKRMFSQVEDLLPYQLGTKIYRDTEEDAQ